MIHTSILPIMADPTVTSNSTGVPAISKVSETIPTVLEKRLKKKKKQPRCALDGCRKKLKYTDYKCRCEHIFCTKHKKSKDHACTIDARQVAQAYLTQQLMKGKSIDTKNLVAI